MFVNHSFDFLRFLLRNRLAAQKCSNKSRQGTFKGSFYKIIGLYSLAFFLRNQRGNNGIFIL